MGLRSSPSLVRQSSARRRRDRGARRGGDDERLTDLKGSVVLDMIEFLQLADGNPMHPGDGSKSLSASDDVSIRVGRDRRRDRRRGRDGVVSGEGFGMFDRLLQMQNLLRKQVDLDVLFVDLFRQANQLWGVGSGAGSGALRVRADQ